MKKLVIGSGIISFLFPLLLILLIAGGQSNYDTTHENTALNDEQRAFISAILPVFMLIVSTIRLMLDLSVSVFRGHVCTC